MIDPDKIADGISGSSFFTEIIYREAVDSTNELLRRRDDLKAGLVAIADTQTNGRGRRGNKWHSPVGGLWMSFLLQLVPPSERLALSLAVAQCLQETVSQFGVKSRVVWPNDLYFGNAKLGGVLIETYDRFAIVGVGLNVNNDTSEIRSRTGVRVSSIRSQVGSKIPLETMIINFLREWENEGLNKFSYPRPKNMSS